MTSKRVLMQVQADNWRDNDSGGVDPEVMADIGYTPFDQFAEVTEAEKIPLSSGRIAVNSELTSAQQNANARRFEDEHSRVSQRQIMDRHGWN